MNQSQTQNLEAKLAEYNSLRTEILQKIEQNNQLLTVTFTSIIAILAFAVTADDPFLFVVPMAVIVPLSMRISYYRGAIAKLSAYIVVYLEEYIDGLNWESLNDKLIRTTKAKKSSHIKLVRHECLVLSIVCYICYLQCLYHHLSDLWYQNVLQILWPISFIVAEASISFDVKVINDERANWIDIWDDFKSASSAINANKSKQSIMGLKITGHERIVALLSVSSIVLTALYFKVYPNAISNVLLGISTGLLAGIVLLVVTGVKSREQKRLTNIYKAIWQIRCLLSEIVSAYSNLYHATYHGKKEQINFQQYKDLTWTAYFSCQHSLEKLIRLDIQIIPANIYRDLIDFINTFKQCLQNLNDRIAQASDKKTLTEIRDEFYSLSHMAYVLRYKLLEQQTIISDEKIRIENSLF